MSPQSFLRWDRCAARDAVDKTGPRGRVGIAGPTEAANDAGIVVEITEAFIFLGVASRLIVSADTDLDVVVAVVVVEVVEVDVVVVDEARGALASRALVLLGRPSEASTIAFCRRAATAFPVSEGLGVGGDFLMVGVATTRGVAYTFLALVVATGILTTLFFRAFFEGVVGTGVEGPGVEGPVEVDDVAGLSTRRFLEGDMGATGGSTTGLRLDEVANLPIILRTVPGVGSELDGDSSFVLLSEPSFFTSMSSVLIRFCAVTLDVCDLWLLARRVLLTGRPERGVDVVVVVVDAFDSQNCARSETGTAGISSGLMSSSYSTLGCKSEFSSAGASSLTGTSSSCLMEISTVTSCSTTVSSTASWMSSFATWMAEDDKVRSESSLACSWMTASLTTTSCSVTEASSFTSSLTAICSVSSSLSRGSSSAALCDLISPVEVVVTVVVEEWSTLVVVTLAKSVPLASSFISCPSLTSSENRSA